MKWSYIDKVLCINLKDSVRRRGHITKEFKKLFAGNEECWDFLEAVYPGHKMYQSHIGNKDKVDTSLGMGPRCFCLARKGEDGKLCTHRRRKLKAAEIAIAMSHYLVYQRVVEKEWNWVLVCEDDISFMSGFGEMIDEVIDDSVWSADRPTMICLGGRNGEVGDLTGKGKGAGKGFSIGLSQKGIYSNYCYLINYSGAKVLMEHFWPITRPEDSFKRWMIHRGLLDGYVVRPSLVQEVSAGINSSRPIFNRLSRANNIGSVAEMRGGGGGLSVEIKGGFRLLKERNGVKESREASVGGKVKRDGKVKRERKLITTGRFTRRVGKS